MKQMGILVTGAAGYIGSVACRLLLSQGHRVRGLDSLLFGGNSLVGLVTHSEFEFVQGDVRDEEVVENALKGMDAVVHLAALVGDKACANDAEAATQVMQTASQALYKAAQKAGLKHFVFASTCSNYGIMEGLADPLLNEDSPMRPQSHYARLKVGFEEFLMEQTTLPWTILRFATAYGHSHRVRFDLTVNHFTRDLTLGRKLEVFGGSTWRPYAHVRDISRAIATVLEKGDQEMDQKIYNVGSSNENYTKEEIVAVVKDCVEEAEVVFIEGKGGDPRNYRVDFSRIQQELDFGLEHTVPFGVLEIFKLVRSGLLSDPDHPTFRNA